MCRALSCVANMFILIFGKMEKCSLSHDSETVPNMFILLETVSGRIRPNTTAFKSDNIIGGLDQTQLLFIGELVPDMIRFSLTNQMRLYWII